MHQRTQVYERREEPSELLVVGYRGTLEAKDDAGTSMRSATEALPYALELLLASCLVDARRLLCLRLSRSPGHSQREPVPLDGLLAALKERLAGIVTHGFAKLCEERSALSQADFFERFPVLRMVVGRSVADWADANSAFLGRLERDEQRIAAFLGLPALPIVESVTATAFDTHAGGRSVLRVCFRGGICVYYKPRPVTGEWLWQQLLGRIAHLDADLRLPAARVLMHSSGSEYGWMESVLPEERTPGHSGRAGHQAEPDYWYGAGAMLCLAQHARLTDLHLGNILATVDGPAVTDAECLATPELQQPRQRIRGGDSPFSHALASLLATGLMPSQQDNGQPETSGYFGRGGPVRGITLPSWSMDDSGVDQLVRSPAVLVTHANAPACVSPLTTLPRLVDGYRCAAKALLAARRSLIEPGSSWRLVLERTHAPRFVVRETLDYALWMSRLLAPPYLRSTSFRRKAMLSMLSQEAALKNSRSELRAEAHALLQVYIPEFVILSGRRTLASNSGRPVCARFVTSTPAEALLREMETLSPGHVEANLVPALMAAVFEARSPHEECAKLRYALGQHVYNS